MSIQVMLIIKFSSFVIQGKRKSWKCHTRFFSHVKYNFNLRVLRMVFSIPNEQVINKYAFSL